MRMMSVLGKARQPHMFWGWNNALPGQKSNTLEMKQIWLGSFINFKIKRSHMISVRLQGNKYPWVEIREGFGLVINIVSLSESSGHWIIHRQMRHWIVPYGPHTSLAWLSFMSSNYLNPRLKILFMRKNMIMWYFCIVTYGPHTSLNLAEFHFVASNYFKWV